MFCIPMRENAVLAPADRKIVRGVVIPRLDPPHVAAAAVHPHVVRGPSSVEIARPCPTMAILDASNMTVCMHAKAAGTKPSPAGTDVRRCERHWTPVHVDLHVHDFDGVLEKLRADGGVIEAECREQGPRPTAFCSDPFGNGFCVIGEAADDE
jgi:predicted enzyme related to lactoylglutathione lyase